MKHAHRFWRPSMLDCAGPWAQRHERYPLTASVADDGDWYVTQHQDTGLSPAGHGHGHPRRPTTGRGQDDDRHGTSRCRRVTGGDVLDMTDALAVAERAEESMNEGAVPVAFGDYMNGIEVRVREGGCDAFLAWADKYLEIDAWIREGDEW